MAPKSGFDMYFALAGVNYQTLPPSPLEYAVLLAPLRSVQFSSVQFSSVLASLGSPLASRNTSHNPDDKKKSVY